MAASLIGPHLPLHAPLMSSVPSVLAWISGCLVPCHVRKHLPTSMYTSQGPVQLALTRSDSCGRCWQAQSPLAGLQERWAGQPSAWCPVAAQLLLSYGRCLGTDLLLEWAAELRAGLGRLFPSPQQAALVMDDSDPGGWGVW